MDITIHEELEDNPKDELTAEGTIPSYYLKSIFIKEVESMIASGEKITLSDKRVLGRYALRYGKEYCRTGCNRCETGCPKEVSIATTLRFQMYFSDYGMEKHAMEAYARLQGNAEKCIDCEDETCLGGCPYELPVSALLRDAHKTLSITV